MLEVRDAGVKVSVVSPGSVATSFSIRGRTPSWKLAAGRRRRRGGARARDAAEGLDPPGRGANADAAEEALRTCTDCGERLAELSQELVTSPPMTYRHEHPRALAHAAERGRLRAARADGGSRDRPRVPDRRAPGGGLPVRARSREPARRRDVRLRVPDRRRLGADAARRRAQLAASGTRAFLGQMRVRLGFGPSGEAASERRTIEVLDVFADPTLEDWQEVATELGFRSFVALPLQTAQAVLGTVTFYFASSKSVSAGDAAPDAHGRRPDGGDGREGAADRGSAQGERGADGVERASSSGSTPTSSRRDGSRTSSSRTSRTSCARRSRP